MLHAINIAKKTHVLSGLPASSAVERPPVRVEGIKGQSSLCAEGRGVHTNTSAQQIYGIKSEWDMELYPTEENRICSKKFILAANNLMLFKKLKHMRELFLPKLQRS